MKKIISKLLIVLTISLMFIGCGKRAMPTTIYTPDLNRIVVAELGANLFTKTYVRLVDKEDNLKYNIRDIRHAFDKLGDTECALYNGINSLLDYNCDGYFTYTS